MSRCKVCFGSGELLGLGHVLKDCPHCNGDGTFSGCAEREKPVHIKRKTRAYSDAAQKLMDKGNLSRSAAEKILDREIADSIK